MFGNYNVDSEQCLQCNDIDCKRIKELKMSCEEQCKKDVTSCDLWDTEHCVLHSKMN